MKSHVLSWMVLMMVMFLSLSLANARGDVRYTVTDLGLMGGSGSHAVGINNNGQVVGYYYASGSIHAFQCDAGGTARELVSPGWTSIMPSQINNSGQVVGSGVPATTGTWTGFLYSGGDQFQEVGSHAQGINDLGQVVGVNYTSDNVGHAFRWTGSGPMQDLGSLGLSSAATKINSKGQVVGNSWLDATNSHPFLWTGSGPMLDLGSLGGQGQANDINDSGQVVGVCSLRGSNPQHAFLWNGTGQLQDLGVLPGGTESDAHAINNAGQIVGMSKTTTEDNEHATLYTASGGLQDLNSLVDTSLGWTLTYAEDINDKGQIVGDGLIGGTTHAFLLTPIPEPSTLILLSIGAIGLIAYAWRRRK